MTIRFTIFLLVLIFLHSCASIKPEAPRASYSSFEIEPRLSVVNVPINISVKEIEKSVNKYLSGLIYEDNNLNDDDMQMKVWKDGNISVDAVADEFKFKVPVKIWLKTGFKVEKFGIVISEYEETNCSMLIDLVSKVLITPNWSVSTSTKITSYEWKIKPALDFKLFNLPLTYFADKIINSNKQTLLSLLDKEVSKYLQIKSYVDEAWKAVQEPILIYDTPPSYISVKPVELRMSPLMGRAGIVQSSVGMKAYTKLHVGQKPSPEQVPLPNLTIDKNETGFFSFYLVSTIDYSEAESLTRKYFEGYIFEFGKKKKVKIEAIDLYGKDGKLILNLKVSGSLKGHLFLSALPYYDAPFKNIKIKNLSFDLDTKNKLLKSADWLAHDLFIKKVESTFSYSLKQDLEETKKLLEESVFDKKVYDHYFIEGSLIQFEPEKIFLTPGGFAALMLVKGTLSVTVKDF
jgi:hypothetical protein